MLELVTIAVVGIAALLLVCLGVLLCLSHAEGEMNRPYSATDICEALGISLDTLYRTRERRHERDQLPRPISEHPLKWERTGFDAWLTRHHPMRPPRPANDVSIVPEPASIAESRARLAAAYAPQRVPAPLDNRRRRAGG